MSATTSASSTTSTIAGVAASVFTRDGIELAVTWYQPVAEPLAVVVVASAMGVPQSFYGAYAGYLAEQGFSVVTFDCRGMGRSLPPERTLSGYPATLDDWALIDYETILLAARTHAGERPLYWIGHSLGGQLPGMLPSRSQIDGLITVAAGSGYWRHNAPQLKRIVWLMWYCTVPLLTPLFGYFPGGRLRQVADLPAGVARQWSRWCRDEEYMVGVEGNAVRAAFESSRFPILSLAFADDEYLSAQSIAILHGFYRSAPLEMRHYAPQQGSFAVSQHTRRVPVQRIGHFGFFKPALRDSLWAATADWLHERRFHSTVRRLREQS